MSMKCIHPHNPLLYSKTGVCRGIPIFLIFAPKHRLWVRVPSINVLSKYYKNIVFSQRNQFQFLELKKKEKKKKKKRNLLIAWASLCNEDTNSSNDCCPHNDVKYLCIISVV